MSLKNRHLNVPSRSVFLACLLGVLIILTGSSCNIQKHLGPNDILVKKNNILYDQEGSFDKKSEYKYELREIIAANQQKPNNKFLGLFRTNLWFYFKTNQPDDTSNFANWIRRAIAEPPTLYSRETSEETSKSIKNYLLNKGYLNTDVSHEVTVKGNMATVDYIIRADQPYLIESMTFRSNDEEIQEILNETSTATVFKPGVPLDANLYDQERSRITNVLRNRGYAYFNRNYISSLNADTSGYSVKAYLEVLPPATDSSHKAFYIGNINFYPNYQPAMDISNLQDTIIDGYYFRLNKEGLNIKPTALINETFLRPGDLFSQEQFDRTYRSLSNLEILKFVSVKFEQDTEYPELLNIQIYLIPNLKMVVGADLELNSSNYESRSDLIGVAGTVLYRNRNLFRGAEVFESRLQAGVEFDRDNNQGIFSRDARFQTDIYFPKYLIPYRWWDTGEDLYDQRDLNIFEQFRKVMTERSQSRLSLGFNFLDYVNSYSYYSFNFSLGHQVPFNAQRQISFNRIGIDYFRPLDQPAGQIPTLIEESFTKQLFTGFVFRDISYLSRTRVNNRGLSKTFRANLEISGLEIALFNFAWNEIGSVNDTLMFPGQIEYSKYVRLELENGLNKIFNPKSSLAARASVGVALPYSSSNTVPFVKQYYVGGPYSIRAWSIRELGPGSYFNPGIVQDNQPFFQTGDIKLELNLEYRFDLLWYLEGAVFLDAGNIWALSGESEAERPGSQISEDFWREIAIGTGAGVRFDFSYFIIRFDIGYKIKAPYQINGSYWAHPNIGEALKDPNYNIAIGYPF